MKDSFVKALELSDSMLRVMENKLTPLQRRRDVLDPLLEDEDPNKAGIVPFIAQQNGSAFRYYVMKPHSKNPELLETRGEPQFQIAKGTRQRGRSNGTDWIERDDSRYNAAEFPLPEPMLRTALREGEEEIGLMPPSIQSILEFGQVAFLSEKKRTGKSMWLYAAEMDSEQGVGELGENHPTTQEGRWCTLEEFRRIGRPDHLQILEKLEESLRNHFREKSQAR